MSDTKAGRKRPRNQYKPWLMLFVRLAIAALILLSVFMVWSNWDKIAPEAILDWSETRFGDAQVGNGFPVSVEGNTVVDMGQINQHLLVLSDTSLQFYNSSASCVITRSHAFSNPTLHTAGRYALITELGGSRFRLDTRRETVMSKEFPNRKIYASCVLSSGMVAVVTDSGSQSYLCEIQVFAKNGKLVYSYQCRKYLITNISLATGGKGLAAVGSTAEGGVLKSVLLLFDFSNAEPTEHSGADLLLYDVNYFSNGTVMALGDRELWLTSSRGDKVEKLSLEGYEPIGYSATPQVAGVVLQRSGSTGGSYVWRLDSSGNIEKSEQTQGEFRHLSSYNGELLMLTESHAYMFNRKGDTQTAEIPSDSLMITRYRNSPVLLTLNELRRIDS